MSNVRAHMPTPSCPNCREPMSAVEQGLGGVWSCLYCEGTWLLPRQGTQLPAEFSGSVPKQAKQSSTPVRAPLLCPTCETESFTEVKDSRAYSCSSCSGVFLEKGVLAQLAPQVISKDGEAPVTLALAATISTMLLADPAILLLALQPKRAK